MPRKKTKPRRNSVGGDTKNARVIFRFPRTLVERLTDDAARQGVSRTLYVEALLQYGLDAGVSVEARPRVSVPTTPANLFD
jgi:hypothetical protein